MKKRENYTIHLFFTGKGFGGSGKRFLMTAISIASARRKFKIYTIQNTYERLSKQINIKNRFISFIIVGSNKDNQKTINKKTLKILSQNYQAQDLLHIHDVNPMISFWKYKYIYSYVCNYFPFESKLRFIQNIKFINRKKGEMFIEQEKSIKGFKSYYRIYMNIFSEIKQVFLMYFANRLDILNPNVYQKAKIFKNKKNISYTKGIAEPSTSSNKKNLVKRENKIIFLGRFDKQKGVNIILSIIPELKKYFSEKKLKYSLDFIGEGELSNKILRYKVKYSCKYFQINAYRSDDIVKDIGKAKIFLSLQDYSNYPSRSLAEAMSLGLIPIVSNTGESKLMLPTNYPYLLESENIETRLLKSLILITNLEKEQINELSNRIFKFSRKKFSSSKQIKYYSSIYDELS